MAKEVKYAIMASGSGTVFQSIIDAQESGQIQNGEIVVLISNKADSGALERARKARIPAHFVDHTAPQEDIDKAIIGILKGSGAQFVFLAGYLKKITPAVLAEIPVYNTHPALDLQKFGGAGMYGLNVHKAVINAGEEFTGATIHEVNSDYDSGKIIMQSRKVKVSEDDTAETLQKKVLEKEYELVPLFIDVLTRSLRNSTPEQKQAGNLKQEVKQEEKTESIKKETLTETITNAEIIKEEPAPEETTVINDEPREEAKEDEEVIYEKQQEEDITQKTTAEYASYIQPDKQTVEQLNFAEILKEAQEKEHVLTRSVKDLIMQSPIFAQENASAKQEEEKAEQTEETTADQTEANPEQTVTTSERIEAKTDTVTEEVEEIACTAEDDAEEHIICEAKDTDPQPEPEEQQAQTKGDSNMKKIVLVGGGGREHAIANQIRRDAPHAKIIAIPGNAGIAQIPNAQCIPLAATDVKAITDFCITENPDLTFVASDDPLALGLVDMLTAKGLRAFGPTQKAAEIEWSKSFSKGFMKRNHIPTANYKVFNNCDDALEFVRDIAPHPLVIKANGLALGKGVVISRNIDESRSAILSIMQDKKFGKAGETIIIEEFLTGPEITLLAFVDGKNYALMPTSQDHKRAFDNDQGPNTGGMGAFSPAAAWSHEMEQEVIRSIVEPTIKGMAAEGREFKGILYFGLMATAFGVKVIEYNARFGDPECQTILPLLETNLIDILNACIDGTLDKIKIKWKNQVALCVVIASAGYPGEIIKDLPIKIEPLVPSVTLIHCGTKQTPEGLVTNGGRVFCLTTTTYTMKQARGMIYNQIKKIQFGGARYRTDIGKK